MKFAVRLAMRNTRSILTMAFVVVAQQACAQASMPDVKAILATFGGASTDSNLAMSLGIPAVTIGGGGEGGNWHARNEWYKPVDAYYGPQNALLMVLMLSGLDGLAKPALAVRWGVNQDLNCLKYSGTCR